MQSQATHDAHAHLQAVYTFMTGMTTFRHFVDDLLSSWPDDDEMLVHTSDDIDWMTVVHYKACVVRLLRDGQWSKAADMMCRAVQIEVQWRIRDWSLCYLEVMYGVGFGEKWRRMEKEDVEKWLGLAFSEISGQLLKQSGQHDMESNSNNQKEPSQPLIQLGKIIGNFAPKIMTLFRYLGHSIKSATITVPTIKYCWKVVLKYDYNRNINIFIEADQICQISFRYIRSLAEKYVHFPFLFVARAKSRYTPVDDSSEINWIVDKAKSLNRHTATYWLSSLLATNQSDAIDFDCTKNCLDRVVTFYHDREDKVSIVSFIVGKFNPRAAATFFAEQLSDKFSIPLSNGVCCMIQGVSYKKTDFRASDIYDFSIFFSNILKDKIKLYSKCSKGITKNVIKEFIDKPIMKPKLEPLLKDNPKFLIIKLDNINESRYQVADMVQELIKLSGYHLVAYQAYDMKWLPVQTEKQSLMTIDAISIILEHHHVNND